MPGGMQRNLQLDGWGDVLSHGEVRELQRERNEAHRKRTGLSSDIRLGVDNLPFSALEKFRDA
jgi:hypothetical protein